MVFFTTVLLTIALVALSAIWLMCLSTKATTATATKTATNLPTTTTATTVAAAPLTRETAATIVSDEAEIREMIKRAGEIENERRRKFYIQIICSLVHLENVPTISFENHSDLYLVLGTEKVVGLMEEYLRTLKPFVYITLANSPRQVIERVLNDYICTHIS